MTNLKKAYHRCPPWHGWHKGLHLGPTPTGVYHYNLRIQDVAPETQGIILPAVCRPNFPFVCLLLSFQYDKYSWKALVPLLPKGLLNPLAKAKISTLSQIDSAAILWLRIWFLPPLQDCSLGRAGWSPTTLCSHRINSPAIYQQCGSVRQTPYRSPPCRTRLSHVKASALFYICPTWGARQGLNTRSGGKGGGSQLPLQGGGWEPWNCTEPPLLVIT